MPLADKNSWFSWRGEALLVQIYLQPRASKDRIVGIHDNHLKISLTTPPVDGRANQHLITFIAECFDVPKSRVTLIKGETGRRKVVKVDKPKDMMLVEKYALNPPYN